MDEGSPGVVGVIPTWAIIPSEGREMVHACLDSARTQTDGIVIVANGGWTPESEKFITDPGPDRNISRWWNLGLDFLADLGLPEWNVLVLNDDVVLGPGVVSELVQALRSGSADLAYPGAIGGTVPEGDPRRITGWCFMLRGESGLRLDESMAWWYGDNDLDWRARQAGGAISVPALRVTHRDPNGYTNRVPGLAMQAGRDRETFLKKWGRLPH